jgi:hypothetical protein
MFFFSFVDLYLIVNFSNETFIDILLSKSRILKTINGKKMTFSEIYKFLSFEETKLIATKLLCPHKII